MNTLDIQNNFLKKINFGSEFIDEVDKRRVKEIGRQELVLNGKKMSLLDESDIRNLQISKGTLLPEERDIINKHIDITIDMLEKLPYPKKLKNVPEFAGGHHEKINGKGYPKGLIGDEMSVQAKIMAIADIFEALTAKDRPYKKGKTLSEAMNILNEMKNNDEIDRDIFHVFVKQHVYKEYAEKFLDKEQVDEVNEDILLSND